MSSKGNLTFTGAGNITVTDGFGNGGGARRSFPAGWRPKGYQGGCGSGSQLGISPDGQADDLLNVKRSRRRRDCSIRRPDQQRRRRREVESATSRQRRQLPQRRIGGGPQRRPVRRSRMIRSPARSASRARRRTAPRTIRRHVWTGYAQRHRYRLLHLPVHDAAPTTAVRGSGSISTAAAPALDERRPRSGDRHRAGERRPDPGGADGKLVVRTTTAGNSARNGRTSPTLRLSQGSILLDGRPLRHPASPTTTAAAASHTQAKLAGTAIAPTASGNTFASMIIIPATPCSGKRLRRRHQQRRPRTAPASSRWPALIPTPTTAPPPSTASTLEVGTRTITNSAPAATVSRTRRSPTHRHASPERGHHRRGRRPLGIPAPNGGNDDRRSQHPVRSPSLPRLPTPVAPISSSTAATSAPSTTRSTSPAPSASTAPF